MKIACIAVVKDEERCIAEWIAYQLALGFDTVILLDNNSTDRSKAIAAAFAPRHDVRLFNWPMRTPDYQLRAYDFAARRFGPEFAWMAFFDIDEFLVLDAGLSLKQCLTGLPDAAAVAISWAMFGSSGHRQAPAGPVIECFLRRSPADFAPNRHVKSIIRPELMLAYSNPHAFDMNGAYVDLAGRPVDWASLGICSAAPDYAGGKLHHYFTRSWEDWLAKLRRGYRDLQRPEEEFYTYDRNEIFDDGAAALAPLVQTILSGIAAEAPAEGAALKLGIAITTLNRCNMVLHLVEKIRELTTMDYDLVICDDGSTDATKSSLLAAGQVVIGGTQRGIAWNKNRGIYYLLHVAKCDVIILLDDDIMPIAAGWEVAWLAATWRHGHMNFAHPSFQSSVIGGAGTATEPYISSAVPGTAYALSRIALAQIGYLDVRFGRYGHEHSDLSFRALRAGFGGIKLREDGREASYFYVIGGGLEAIPAATSGTPEELESNGRLLGALANEPIYRHAWTSDVMRDVFLGEIEAALGVSDSPLRLKNYFLSWRDYLIAGGAPPEKGADDRHKNLALRKPALQSSICGWSRHPSPAEDAAGALNGRIDGTAKFHTGLEENPWWQVDLGGLAIIREIRIYNVTGETAARFKHFCLAVSIDGNAWVPLIEKRDDTETARPFIWNGPGTAFAQFVRITLLGRDFLHLDQVEVFGELTGPGLMPE